MLLHDGKSADYLARPVLGIHSILITQRAALPGQFIAREVHSSKFCLTQLLTLAGQVFWSGSFTKAGQRNGSSPEVVFSRF